MADYAALQEQNKLAALRAMAAGNPDPYAGSSDVISGAQDEALNRFAGDAAGRQAPAGSISQGEAMIRAPGDAALAGLTAQGSAQAADLAALKAEAENAAANPSSVPQFSSGTSGGRQPTKAELQRAQGYNQYGGYNTAAEYENAALGRAMEMRDQRDEQAKQAEAQAADVSATASVEPGIAALKAQQASNAAIVGGPGAVIHGIGWKDNPTPWSPPPPVIPTHRDIGVAAMPNVGPGGMLVPPPPPQGPAPPPLTFGPANTSRPTTNYTPEATAMLRAAANQTYKPYSDLAYNTPLGPAPVAQTWEPRIAAVEDPRNIYEFARKAAVDELGGDTYEAMGRFSPDWGMKTYAIPEAQGPLRYQAIQNEALERHANDAAGLGAYTDAEVRARHTDAIRGSGDYKTGLAVVQAQQSSLAGGPKSDQPVTVDGLKVALEKAGVDPVAAAQIIKDFGGLYPGASFYNQPEDVMNAASSVGSQPITVAGNANG